MCDQESKTSVKDENPFSNKCKANLGLLQKAHRTLAKDVQELRSMLSQYKAKKGLTDQHMSNRDKIADGLVSFAPLLEEAGDMIEELKLMPDNEDQEVAEPMAVKSGTFLSGLQAYLDATKQMKKECKP